ncbi:MAG TPA: MgtC/SapB family protein [Prolixibacteraceae bacterium]|nr:MgtC/SapB family protein [Prolixibacteraceae bacterium]
MENLEQIIQSNEVTWESALVRILVAFILGMLIGIERETQDQPAGMRTHILICIGATVVMLISIFIPQTFTNFQNGDPGRIAAQVVSGIGFLGAGAILKFGTDIKGLTTAASIWTIAAVGLAVGAGMFVVAFIAVGVILFALTIMDIFEKKLFKERTLRKIELVVNRRNSDLNQVKQLLKERNIKVVSTGFERNLGEANDKITFMVGVTPLLDIQKLSDELETQTGIVSISVGIIE